ncbi:gluconokinase, GntK/IdnK-type [Paracoccus sp. S1E-3]|uniref:gluconokinase n=1 Tax=Paracoccus sp. S1E-3 TaxID=2756130 RepID=UPI0015EE63DB|nr:gluconokinase, GntK/IdnK-type [Paracoccus sp. S1E-3]MBA4489801.1 AAA family ATPase [Paracoccus sp. S1E-3]
MRAVIVMGVSGCGKSLLAQRLAAALHASLIEADDLHSAANRRKMAAGIALTDEDRWPWLDAVGQRLGDLTRRDGVAVAACSALRQTYRDRLEQAAELPIRYIHLGGSREVIAARMVARSGHFMNPALLESQIATLEPPSGENVLACDVVDAPAQLLMAATDWLSCGRPVILRTER